MFPVYDEQAVPRCPLCFTVLDQNQYLIRFCPGDEIRHQQKVWGQFNCTPSNLVDLIRCWDKQCRLVTQLRAAVHFLHLGCPAVNPFWNPGAAGGEGRVEIDDISVEFTRLVTDAAGNERREKRRVPVTHWQITMLRQAAAIPELAARSEMWYPQLLLRAMYERNQGTALGQRVKLGGSKGVGKSIAATMMLSSSNINGGKYLGNYVYMAPDTTVANRSAAFLSALYPFQVLEAARTGETQWVAPTRANAGLNLKAVFLEPDSESPANEDLSWWKRVLRNAELVNAAESPTKSSGILLYDTAGEDGQGDQNPFFLELDQRADIVAAVVAPTDFLATNANAQPALTGADPSAATAVRILRGMANPRAAKCVIVTKLDLVRLAGDLQRNLEQVLQAIQQDSTSRPGREREVLLEMLRATGSGGQVKLQAELSRQVANREAVHRVFFIWTEGADQPNQFPVTHGVNKFLAWCREGAPAEGSEQASAGFARS